MADHTAAADAIHHVHRLLEIAFQHHGDLARDRVGAAARRPRHDQRDRPFGKRRAGALRAKHADGRQQHGAKFSDVAKHSHSPP